MLFLLRGMAASSPLYITTMMAQVPSLLLLDGKKVRKIRLFSANAGILIVKISMVFQI